ncbi:MAG: cupin domain-containing protein [Desulfobacterales bacterium]|nr:cupin domain-containing protein [Desulfobacterales bacterium]
MTELLPEMITSLPLIETPSDSIKGHLIQGESNQSVYFIVKAGTFLPEHSHAAQWGIVIDGEFEITYADKTYIYRKGDTYFVPEGTPHSGKYITDVVSFDVFDDNSKFKMKVDNIRESLKTAL